MGSGFVRGRACAAKEIGQGARVGDWIFRHGPAHLEEIFRSPLARLSRHEDSDLPPGLWRHSQETARLHLDGRAFATVLPSLGAEDSWYVVYMTI